MNSNIPQIISEIGFDFDWSEQKVWELDLPVEDMSINDLSWHFDIPFWNKPTGHYDLKPTDVMNHKEAYPAEYQRILRADTTFPLDIMFWKNRWLLLDGLHRLVKLSLEGKSTIKVRKVPTSMIPLIGDE